MRITITAEFASVEDAAKFLGQGALRRQLAPIDLVQQGALLETRPDVLEGTAACAPAPTDKPARKPRADAGKSREPYGPRATTAEPAPAAAQAQEAQRPDQQAPAPASTPASPTATPAPEFPATLEGARAAMKKLNDAPGKGMDACIAALKANGVTRISDLPKEKYATFIEYVLAQVPAKK